MSQWLLTKLTIRLWFLTPVHIYCWQRSRSQLVTWTCWEPELRLCVHLRAHMWLCVYSIIYGACVYVCARAYVCCVCTRVRLCVCTLVCIAMYVLVNITLFDWPYLTHTWYTAIWRTPDILVDPIWCTALVANMVMFLFDVHLAYFYLTHTGHTGRPYMMHSTGG